MICICVPASWNKFYKESEVDFDFKWTVVLIRRSLEAHSVCDVCEVFSLPADGKGR